MKLFREAIDSPLYQIHGIDEETLIYWFSIFQTHKITLKQLLSLKNPDLLRTTQSKDINEIRQTLKAQIKACDDYIAFWKEASNPDANNKGQN
jgi:hypothetical protein